MSVKIIFRSLTAAFICNCGAFGYEVQKASSMDEAFREKFELHVVTTAEVVERKKGGNVGEIRMMFTNGSNEPVFVQAVAQLLHISKIGGVPVRENDKLIVPEELPASAYPFWRVIGDTSYAEMTRTASLSAPIDDETMKDVVELLKDRGVSDKTIRENGIEIDAVIRVHIFKSAEKEAFSIDYKTNLHLRLVDSANATKRGE